MSHTRSLAAQTVAEVQVTPETMTLAVGQKQTMFAAAFDRQGNLISNARFTFRSSDTTIARVEPDGVVVGLAPGLARVEARVQTRRGSLAVLVTGPGGAGPTPGTSAQMEGVTLTVEPASLRLLPGETVRLVPQAVTDVGNVGDPGVVTWKSLRPELARVDSSGLVTGIADGRTIIQVATPNGLMATAPVEVQAAEIVLSKPRIALPPDGLDTLQILVPSQSNRIPTSGAEWVSTDSSVARVGPTGIVQGVRPGKAEIIVRGHAQELRAPVVIYPPPATVILTPRPGTTPIPVPLGQSRRIVAVAQAADSSPIPDVRVQWEVADSALASYDAATGELTGRALGTSSLTARVAGFQPASWAITVVPNRMQLERSRIGLVPGASRSVGASLLNDDGKVVGSATQLTWTSDRPEVAAVDASGAIRAGKIGRATITAATSWGVSAKLDVFVTGDLLLASNRGGTVGIWQARLSSPDALLPVLADSTANLQPAWSPDRTRIAFSSNRGDRDGNFDLFVMDADGTNIRRLTTERGSDGEPAWTPAGDSIVFSSARGGTPQLYVISAETGTARPLTATPGGNQTPVVSADGRIIAFVSLRDGTPRIYRMGIDGSGEGRVGTGTGTLKEGAPAFLPGGELLYGVERSRNSREWRVVRAGAGAPAPLFDTEQPLSTLSASRDGARVVYVTVRGNRPEYRVFLRPLTPAAPPLQLRPRQGEQVSSATF